MSRGQHDCGRKGKVEKGKREEVLPLGPRQQKLMGISQSALFKGKKGPLSPRKGKGGRKKVVLAKENGEA